MAITDLIPWKRSEREATTRVEMEHPLRVFEREMNRLFDDFLSPFGSFGWGDERLVTFSPRVDVVENDKEVKISAELPGMEEKDINVSLARDALTISGEKREEKEDRGKNFYRMERSYGSFQRTIPLPCEVDSDRASATFKKGVLTITLPKTAEAQCRKKIPIKTT